MIHFKKIEIEDKETIESYTMSCDMRNNDLSFANMYCWQPHYQSSWAIVDNALVIRFKIDGGREYGYLQPIGTGDISQIIPQLAMDAHALGVRLTIVGMNEQGCRELRTKYGFHFALYSARDCEDYIYERHALATLSGRQYQHKRNHINRFKELYSYEYQPLTAAHFGSCLELASRWQDSKCCSAELLNLEQQAIIRAINNYDALSLIGGALIIEGRLAAFTYGSALNHNTFCTHIEKADTSIHGAYEMINHLFASSLPAHFHYINREEDMGIEGLRRSKLSWHPRSIQQKFRAIYLHHDELQCRALWNTVFGDKIEFIDKFIINHYDRTRMLCITDSLNNYISMLHIIPFTCDIGEVAYIYGVATHERHRSHGHATRLMQAAMSKTKNDGYSAVILIPSEPWLIEFYSRFRFETHCQVRFKSSDNFDFGIGGAAVNEALIYNFRSEEPPKILTLTREPSTY